LINDWKLIKAVLNQFQKLVLPSDIKVYIPDSNVNILVTTLTSSGLPIALSVFDTLGGGGLGLYQYLLIFLEIIFKTI